jgi:hypothetical protein
MIAWLFGCLLLTIALPAAVMALKPILALGALVVIAGGWLLLLRLAPDLGMAGGMLLFASWGISGFAALAALLIRVRDAMAENAKYRH